jgi:uncharacterized MAPEG superfamily protein
MTIPFWCLLIAALIPILLAWVGGYYRHRQLGSVDNKHPRQQALLLEGAGARVMAAQQNAWEALIIFTGAVLVAHVSGAVGSQASTAALIFIAARILHAGFYIANLDALRSLSFLVGLGCSIWLYAMAI